MVCRLCVGLSRQTFCLAIDAVSLHNSLPSAVAAASGWPHKTPQKKYYLGFIRPQFWEDCGYFWQHGNKLMLHKTVENPNSRKSVVAIHISRSQRPFLREYREDRCISFQYRRFLASEGKTYRSSPMQNNHQILLPLPLLQAIIIFRYVTEKIGNPRHLEWVWRSSCLGLVAVLFGLVTT